MGALLFIVNDDFEKEKDYGHIPDYILEPIIEEAKKQSFTCLRYVLIYENTCFNSEQMEDIKKEIEILDSIFKDRQYKTVFRKILSAIEYAQKDPPLYLFFEGD
ncbi:hypothetical protein D1AOALGA4SA_4654 [Olavius algarvensis Delta 1 endosymbiont]|nr:hypothetical protein D1AOALGA4SA_4654 [Olavius algarvensis Delta 1 endosymbiont]